MVLLPTQAMPVRRTFIAFDAPWVMSGRPGLESR
jgi:hypothetical protein